MIAGPAKDQEILNLLNILEDYHNVSRLQINPLKSILWFSQSCTDVLKDHIASLWKARKAGRVEKYLGVQLYHPPNYRNYNTDSLLHSFTKTLGGWKANTLSYAGRLVLLKSVLLSLPVYAFSVNLFPKKTINDLTSVARKFFWGKIGRKKYLSLISWKKLQIPLDKGGLGIKDLELFNQALMLKWVWLLVDNRKSVWKEIIKDKYYTNKGFWGTINVRGSSLFWKNIQQLKHHFKDHIYWKIGNGETVNLRGEPWFYNWQKGLNLTRKRNCTLSQAIDSDTGNWKSSILFDMFPTIIANQIRASRPPVLTSDPDVLLWKQGKNNPYTSNQGYKWLYSLTHTTISNNQQDLDFNWQNLWKHDGLSPKVKLFMWRMLTNSLPTNWNLHKRIPSISQNCKRCKWPIEDIVHTFFGCASSQEIWYRTNTAILSIIMGLLFSSSPNIQQMVSRLLSEPNTENFTIFASMCWHIWEMRNDFLFNATKLNPLKTWLKAINYSKLYREINKKKQEQGWKHLHITPWTRVILVDGSWFEPDRGAIGVIAFDTDDKAEHFIGKRINSQCPLHSELMAMEAGIRYATLSPQSSQTNWIILTDCQQLFEAIIQNDGSIFNNTGILRDFEVLSYSYRRIKERLRIELVSRQRVRQAHDLAKSVSNHSLELHGYPTAQQLAKMKNISLSLEISTDRSGDFN
ncbi:RNA-directed DNA polymerase (reverse transcriptase)-related family protein [Rhynchospora pubera]|uniref:RNA-directed DNA polymerase (Reverse transcriptase)-related family protein n=1 Tax=Rhynchospora pubera TaxID=906938 RepID=A0AAV8E7Y6_9POAL|nr:RNA-directed DNA polymerase (reverse transcriptase)-related family protein [Rhynchospora pubera]